MKIPEDCELAYIVRNEAWYWLDHPSEPYPSLMVQAAAFEGGVAWEFEVTEQDLGGPTIQVCMYEDSFDAYVQIPEFFTALVKQKPRTLIELRRLLDGIGARDATERTRAEVDG